ncbi:MAG: MarR family transcriptional regulator [Verrucomicrobiaceae bacterium]|nr:MAG: MarR family transcriptional regulator [Verrucomicrobiaceae bacterium]
MKAPSPKQLSDADYTRLGDFRYALRCFLEFSELAAAKEGVTPQQHQALLVIRASPDAVASVGRLAERLRIRHNTAVELAQRLEIAGLITRQPSPDDGRSVLLRLSPEGEAKLEVLTHVHRAELKKLRPEITALLQSLEPVEAK